MFQASEDPLAKRMRHASRDSSDSVNDEVVQLVTSGADRRGRDGPLDSAWRGDMDKGTLAFSFCPN